MIKIPNDVKTVMDILTAGGHKAYVVGGCVRDSIMGREPNDWDVTTDADPEQIQKLFESFRTVETGIKHGTVLIVSGKTPVETTTFRIDGEYSDNRHPDKVTFTKNIIDDLARRDFTINAMAYNETEGIIDPFDGQSDIRNKIIRCVGDADTRFNEDALRIMRAIRFSSVLGFNIEEKTAESIIKNENLLSGIACERITTELLKLLCGSNVFSVLTEFRSVIGVFIPELKLEFDFKQYGKKHGYDVWMHTVHTVNNIENDPILRLTMLLHDTGKIATHVIDENNNSTFKNHAAVGGVIAENILRRLKFSKEYINTVSFLVSIHDKDVPETRVQVKEYIRDLGEENFIRLMKIRRADKSGLAKAFRDITDKLIFAYSTFDDIMNKNEPYSVQQLAVNGNDIKKYVSGSEIKNVLNHLLETVIHEPEKNNKETLLELAKRYK
ncbi:MAG: HD domain-containing protein [Clostridia bacterium]|nr:HD domain-containing protein [Clostridia bacterium]